jgi:hypothetical protein
MWLKNGAMLPRICQLWQGCGVQFLTKKIAAR